MRLNGNGDTPTEKMDGLMSQPELSIYVHIPFCETKCPYCDFNTYAGIEDLIPVYVDALAAEIRAWGIITGHPNVGTIFFGGGTPSYIPGESLARLFDTLTESFSVSPDAEVTLEANPGDMDLSRVRQIVKTGFNRISIGVQTLDTGLLNILGRRHTAARAKESILLAREGGFQNISLDLMFGLPNQTLKSWEETLSEALTLSSDHLSLYSLTLEQGTPMERDVRLGRVSTPDLDLAADMYESAQKILSKTGHVQYEISNWAMPGYSSKHNLTYWRNQPYLGVGPGAHSYLFANGLNGLESLGSTGVRFAAIRPPKNYITAIEHWEAPTIALEEDSLNGMPFIELIDPISRDAAMKETMMMGLRLNEGVRDSEFRERFGQSIGEVFPEALCECLELGLLNWDDGCLQLTDYGRILGNEAFQRFIA